MVPRWLDAYRRFCDVGRNDAVPVHRELLVAFLRQEKARDRKAWQRLQIVRAVEHYHNAVLGTAAPDLGDIRDTLAQVAERDFGPTHDMDVVGITVRGDRFRTNFTFHRGDVPESLDGELSETNLSLVFFTTGPVVEPLSSRSIRHTLA